MNLRLVQLAVGWLVLCALTGSGTYYGLIELDQRSVPGLLCCFSLSVSRSPSACHKVAACVLEIAIRIRVSRSTDDLASLVPRNVMRILPMLSSL